MTLWEFDGVLKYSPLFYGWYANTSSGGYKVPLAYFLTGLFVYGYSFFATLRKMAENSRTSKLSEKDDELIFTWKVFTAWDYMIGNAETAHNRVSSIIMGFKEALLEEAEKKKDIRSWRVTSIRVLVNIVVIALLALSMYVVVLVVKRSTEPEAESSFWRKNEIAIVMSLITFVFPMVFEILGLFEQYHPRKQLRLQLGRIMVLNLVNLYSLIFALIDKIGDMTTELQTFKNITNMINDSLSLSTTTSSLEFVTTTECFCNSNRESLLSRSQVLEPEVLFLNSQLSGLVSNITNLMITNITTTFNESLSDINFLNTSLSNFVNSVIQEKIIGNLSSTLFENITIPTFQELNFTDIEYKFADYLTYLLFSLQDSTANTTLTYDNSTDLNDNITVTTWDEFSSTIFPLLNNTDSSTDVGRFDYDFSPSTIFDFTSTTLHEETSTDPPECKKFCEQSNRTVENVEQGMNYTMKARFRNLCWETMFGQELISITIMDLIMTIVPSLGMDFFRGIFVRVMNRCWCWDLEKKFPKYGDFKVAENILSLVNNQGMVWMGMFFCPGLVLLNVIKLYITMYFKSWTVMTCNVPPEVIFRASRSNNFYYYLLLMMLFLCVLPVGYTIVWIKPSWHCGPFSKYPRIFHIFTKTIKDNVPDVLQRVLEYIASPGIVIPLLVLLILIIYYLLSLTNSLREANEELKIQLRRERTEERRKMFQLADRRRRGGSGESNELANTPFTKWKKLLGNLPSGKSLDDTPKQEADDAQNNNERIENRGKDFFSKLIKKALRKSSTSEDEMNAEDETDTEQHDSLPYDSLGIKSAREVKPSFSWGTTDFQNIARKALQLKAKPDVQQSKSSEIITEPKHVQIDHKAIIKLQKSDVNKKITDIKEAVNESKLQERDKQKLEFVKEKPVEQISSTIKEEPHKIVTRRRSHTKTTIPTIEEVQITNEASTSNNIVRRNSDVSKNKPIKEVISEASTSTSTRQDSESSIWSDGIPVIKISKTDSSENILHACDEPWAEEENDETIPKRTEDGVTKNFKPRIRSALRKQSSIDEDTIRYFNDDLERNISMENAIKAVAEENVSEDYEKWLSPDDDSKGDEALTDKSSSEDTDHKDCSTDTILRSPKENDSH